MNEEIPYRSPAHVSPAAAAPDKDDEDFSSLREVQKLLKESIEALYKDFNAFSVLREGGDKEAMESLVRQVAGKKEAYEILVPLESMIDSAIESVRERRRG